jgi:hypothetical protein
MLAPRRRNAKHLPSAARPPTSLPMFSRENWRWFIDHPVVEWSIFVVGLILILLSPLAGVVPGPGGIFVFAIGLAMVLKTSMWAKRHYVKFKRWQPKAGRWADWGLRRRSARRREALRKQRDEIACPPPTAEPAKSPVEPELPGRPVDPAIAVGREDPGD